jgi:predicted alpha/beta superfamily hydrolase
LMSFRNGKLIVGSHSGSLFVAYYWLNHALFFFQKYFLRYISLWGNDQIILKRP